MTKNTNSIRWNVDAWKKKKKRILVENWAIHQVELYNTWTNVVPYVVVLHTYQCLWIRLYLYKIIHTKHVIVFIIPIYYLETKKEYVLFYKIILPRLYTSCFVRFSRKPSVLENNFIMWLSKLLCDLSGNRINFGISNDVLNNSSFVDTS